MFESESKIVSREFINDPITYNLADSGARGGFKGE